jgi:hypothetical protein
MNLKHETRPFWSRFMFQAILSPDYLIARLSNRLILCLMHEEDARTPLVRVD